MLTGISNSMVADSPSIDSALPAFLEFAAGSVLVAHNAPFDVGFLRHFCEVQERPWPTFEVVDTAKLARRVITRDDAPNCKLSSLARAFRSTTTPNHRALSDARATVDVLHGLMERLGGARRAHARGAADLLLAGERGAAAQAPPCRWPPHAPGVYLFRDDRSRVLYVGTSRVLRTRVRSYFTASETRWRMGEMVGIATSVTGIECATPLEAEVRELRLIAEHKPRYNRRSRFPEKVNFLKLTREAWPRLSLVQKVLDDDADYLGPFWSRKMAEKCLAALHETFPVRQCTEPGCGRRAPPACSPRWAAACRPVTARRQRHYGAVVRRLRDTILQRSEEVVEASTPGCRRSLPRSASKKPSVRRDRLAAFVRATARSQRLTSLTRMCPRWSQPGARTTVAGPSTSFVRRARGRRGIRRVPTPTPFVAELRAMAETVTPAPGPVPAATAEESERVLRWLESPTIRLIAATASGPARSTAPPATSPRQSSSRRRSMLPWRPVASADD